MSTSPSPRSESLAPSCRLLPTHPRKSKCKFKSISAGFHLRRSNSFNGGERWRNEHLLSGAIDVDIVQLIWSLHIYIGITVKAFVYRTQATAVGRRGQVGLDIYTEYTQYTHGSDRKRSDLIRRIPVLLLIQQQSHAMRQYRGWVESAHMGTWVLIKKKSCRVHMIMIIAVRSLRCYGCDLFLVLIARLICN